VVVSSVNRNVLFNDPGSVAYSATKAAQVAMVKVLAIELADAGIRINAVLPGSIRTDIEDNTWRHRMSKIGGPEVKYPEGEIPLGRKEAGTSEDVAAAILLLASDAAGHVTGTAITVDGGQSLIA
jgi:NAD(P)-dependent dehydrogenase (short-subunit alcohol dehydrogenase family)